MKAYSSFSWEQKEKIYSLARAGVSDAALCERYDVDEAILLRMYDEVLCELQRRRGYSGLKTVNDFFRNVDLSNGDGDGDDKEKAANEDAQSRNGEVHKED